MVVSWEQGRERDGKHESEREQLGCRKEGKKGKKKRRIRKWNGKKVGGWKRRTEEEWKERRKTKGKREQREGKGERG